MHSTVMKEQRITNEDRRILHQLLIDFIIFVVLIVPILICEFIIEPFRRGFFCNDETIRYPYRENSITTTTLLLLVTLLPAVIVIIVEYIRHRKCANACNKSLLLFGKKIPIWIVEILKNAGYYIFGGLVTFNATELGKYGVGRLRPYFISVCQPQITDGSSCDEPQNLYRYIEDYVCIGTDYTQDDIRQARLSFPSGHCSLIFYTVIFLVVYLQYKFTWSGSKLMRYFLQSALLMLAWYTALSRVVDNWHHWSDALSGSLLGTGGALFAVFFLANNFRIPLMERLHANLPRHDTTTTLDEIVGTLPTFTQQNGVGGTVTSRNGDSADRSINTRSFSNDQYCTKV